MKKHNIIVEGIRIDEITGKRFTFIFDPDNLPIELYEKWLNQPLIKNAFSCKRGRKPYHEKKTAFIIFLFLIYILALFTLHS